MRQQRIDLSTERVVATARLRQERLALTSGATYWIAENVSLCSIAAAGVQQPYYSSFNTLAGPWGGPFMGHAWTSHVIGECVK